MRNIIILSLAIVIFGTGVCNAQIVDDLNDVAVWAFGPVVWCDSVVDAAAYIEPQFIKRAWFKYDNIQYSYFSDPAFSLWTIPPLLNASGALFEGGVQVACIDPGMQAGPATMNTMMTTCRHTVSLTPSSTTSQQETRTIAFIGYRIYTITWFVTHP